MSEHTSLSQRELFKLLKNRSILFAGNKKLKIYGELNCRSGKRMKKSNRIFFTSQKQATDLGFRPCAHCLKTNYTFWKERKKQVEIEKQNRQL
jgi:methylphosphotriester-DNA--protein-cysteine methyltransferase